MGAKWPGRGHAGTLAWLVEALTLGGAASVDEPAPGERLPLELSQGGNRPPLGEVRILTSNKSFTEWHDILGDDVIAAAILDGLLHDSYVLSIRGHSYRLRDKLDAAARGPLKPQALEPVAGGQKGTELLVLSGTCPLTPRVRPTGSPPGSPVR
jgi:hypothetical protein